MPGPKSQLLRGEVPIRPVPEKVKNYLSQDRRVRKVGRTNRSPISKGVLVNPGEDIQAAIDSVEKDGGGIVNLISGTYTVDYDIVIPSFVSLVGASMYGTVIDFGNNANKISIQGSDEYDTGTITSITSGVSVTGSGTSWLANVTPLQSQLFINQRWHLIAAVTSNTTLILAEGYTGPTVTAGTAYRISAPATSVMMDSFNVKSSSGTAIVVENGRNIMFSKVVALQSNAGVDFSYVTEVQFDQVIGAANTTFGARLTQCGFGDLESLAAEGNATGVILNNCRTIPLATSGCNGNTGNGYEVTDCTDVVMMVQANRNGGKGIELISGNDNVLIETGLFAGNGSDNIKITATSDNCKVIKCHIINAGGYGINIAASTCDDTIIALNTIDGNSSGAINDAGTDTIIIGNEGSGDSQLKSKSITIEDPSSSENVSMFFTDKAITIQAMRMVIVGSTSVTTTVRHSTDRSATGNEVVTSGTVVDSTTTGEDITSFNDATIPADSFVWVETTALSGTPDSVQVTVFYTEDI